MNWNLLTPFHVDTVNSIKHRTTKIFICIVYFFSAKRIYYYYAYNQSQVYVKLLKWVFITKKFQDQDQNQENYKDLSEDLFKRQQQRAIMGGKQFSFCEAITAAEVFVKLGTPHQQIQKFLKLFPKINQTLKKANLIPEFDIFNSQTATKYINVIYIGSKDDKGYPQTKPNQKGLLLYDCGFLYYGQVKDAKRNGQGLMIDEQGDYYLGKWSDGSPNGQGTYFAINNNRRYQGNWVDGHQSGQGQQFYQDGSNYKGCFYKGFKQGKGKLQYPDKTYYEGEFKNSAIDGYGISKGKFHQYQGQWKQGKMHGNGKSIWYDENGQVIGMYIGQYQKGLKHGFGQYKWGNKKIYKGKFQEGDMTSQGVLLNYQ